MPFKELEVVQLARDTPAMVGLPRGLQGTIVLVYPDGYYEVEFSDGEGRSFLVELSDDDLKPR